MGNRYVKRSHTRKIQNWDITNSYRTSICQFLPTGNFVETEVAERKEDGLIKSVLDTKDDHKHGQFMKCDLEDPRNKIKKTKHFPFYPEKKQSKSLFCQNIWWRINH